MPDINQEAKALRDRAAQMRALSQQHADAGNPQIAAKLAALADELEAKAAEIEKRQSPA